MPTLRINAVDDRPTLHIGTGCWRRTLDRTDSRTGPVVAMIHGFKYLPGHPLQLTGGQKATLAVAAAPWGSASILLISYAYIKMLGAKGLKAASEYAILNANYIKARIEAHYDVLFTGEKGRAAHELQVSVTPDQPQYGVRGTARVLEMWLSNLCH